MPIKTALVGIGKIARDQHIPALTANPDFDLVAAVSRNAQIDGIANYATLDAMLAAEPEIELISLCMPPAARYTYAATAISAGRHVMLEKPPGATLSECHELERLAQSKGVSLFATWHSRYAAAVSTAKAWLADKTIISVAITWKEDVRRWHPGQDWIWQAGGMGVFDPGINALSILTEIMPRQIFITSATLDFPSNCETPVAADISFHDPGGAKVTMVLDWLQKGPQTWDIAVETSDGPMLLSNGGATMTATGFTGEDAPLDGEYAGLYARMATLIKDGKSDVDLSPMRHVADAFTIGRRRQVDPFHF